MFKSNVAEVIGPLPGRPTFDVAQSFFEPMPADELDLWEQGASTDPLGAAGRGQRAQRTPTRAAKARAVSRQDHL